MMQIGTEVTQNTNGIPKKMKNMAVARTIIWRVIYKNSNDIESLLHFAAQSSLPPEKDKTKKRLKISREHSL
jgi:hypothetical protein